MKKTSNRRSAKAKRGPVPAKQAPTAAMAPSNAAGAEAAPPPDAPAAVAPVPPPETSSPPPDAPALVQLEHSLQIKDVEAAHRQFMTALGGGGVVTVDLARLGVIDTAGVQLMLALKREAAQRGIALEVRGDSAALTQALTVLGLRDAFAVATPP